MYVQAGLKFFVAHGAQIHQDNISCLNKTWLIMTVRQILKKNVVN